MPNGRIRIILGHGMRYTSPSGLLPCFECGVVTRGRHHVIPVSKGGTKALPLCGPCHATVHNGVELSPLIKAGLIKAKNRGAVFGAPTKTNEDIKKSIRTKRAKGETYKVLAEQFGLAVGTIFNIVSEAKKEIPTEKQGSQGTEIFLFEPTPPA